VLHLLQDLILFISLVGGVKNWTSVWELYLCNVV
jgi:hypothetical protein